MILKKRNLGPYLESKKLFHDYKVIGVKSGLSNSNFIIEENGKKYIVRSNKDKPSKSINILENEHHTLKFLESKNINFVPRSIYYDKENNIHILRYLDGKQKRFKNISLPRMQEAIEKLHQINILASEYDKYCKKHKIKQLQPKSEVESIHKQIISKLETVPTIHIFYQYKKWILNRLKKDFTKYKINKNKIFLNHGDPADNLIIYKKEIFIIDWEYVRFTYGPGLVHILAHGRLNYDKEKTLLKIYEKISGIPYQELYVKTYTEKMAHYLLKIAKILNKKLDADEKETKEHIENIKNLQELYLTIHNRLSIIEKFNEILR